MTINGAKGGNGIYEYSMYASLKDDAQVGIESQELIWTLTPQLSSEE